MSEELDRLESLLAKATPGPWDVVIDPDGPPRVYRGRSGGFCVSDRADHLRADADAGLIVGLRNAAPALLAAAREAEELRAFKTYVHDRLDVAGIPTHPNGPHSAAGCRIGDRLDIALAAAREAEELRAWQREAIEWFRGELDRSRATE